MTTRPSDPNRPSSAPTEDGWEEALDEKPKTPVQTVQTLPVGTPKPPLALEKAPVVYERKGARSGPTTPTVRFPMESVIELDDEALLEVTDPAIVASPRPSPQPPPPSARRPAPPASKRPDAVGLLGHQDDLIAELARRGQELEGRDTPVALSRARVELGMALELLVGDRDEALVQYQRAHEAAPDAEAPLLAARWLTPSRPLGPALKLAQAHARIARDDAQRAERAVQLAELHRSASHLDDARAAYRQALSMKPTLPAALRGQEGVLQAQLRAGAGSAAQALGAHLEDMASALAAEPSFSAWIHVERAALLDADRKHDAARAALELAMKLDGSSPSVRAAYTRHLLLRRATDALVAAWSQHAESEPDGPRGARYEYAAGRLASERLDDANLAIELHTRAAARVEANVDVRRSALRELARLHAELGNPRAASEARERHLALVEDPVRRCHEHRRLAESYELLGEHENVVRHCHQILTFDAGDRSSRDRLDRALQALHRHEERIALWSAESARLTSEKDRAEALVRAARIAEGKLRDQARAESLYRAAWASDPASVDAFDGLSRLLVRPGSPSGDIDPPHARARIDLYEQAAMQATDKERRIACLEKVAHIWEDELHQPTRALDVYRRLSDLDDRRRSTILGLQRCAGLAGEYDLLVQSLVREADSVQDPSLQRTLLLRAAGLAAEELGDADAAMGWIGRVLSRSPGDPLALRAAWHVNRQTGRNEQALEQLRLLLKHTRRGPAAFALCMEMATLLEDQLRRPVEAVQAYREAAGHDPEHPAPPLEIPRILLSLGEHRKAAEQLVDLASQVSNPYARARLLVQAAEVFDDRLDDLDAAMIALTQAQALVPSDAAVFERLVRVQERRGKPAELIPLLDKRIAASAGAAKLALQIQLADLLSRERDHAKAATVLREIVDADSRNMAALRMYEQALRRLERWDDLAGLLHHEASVFADPAARLGALFEAHYHEDSTTGASDNALATLDQIRAISPQDPFVHEAIIRSVGLSGRGPSARQLAQALAQMASAHEPDSFLSAVLHLGAAWRLEAIGEEEDATATREALGHYRACLSHWPHSLTAARGLLRIGQTLGDKASEVEAHAALGRIESEARTRAAHNAAAAEALADTGEPLGRAFELFGKALQDDPDCQPAARGIVALLDRGADPGHVADTLRVALDGAREKDQVVLIGAALGRLARDVLRDPNGAVEAFRKVRDRAPGHVPSLLELAEACVALRLWYEAGEVAQSVLGISNDHADHLQALVILAEAHAHVQAKWTDARREATDAELAAESLDHEPRRAIILRLARVYEALGDKPEQDRLLCLQAALAGPDATPLRELAARYDTTGVEGCIAYVQQLNRVIAMGEVLGVPPQPSWLVELGRLEALRLSRPREGLAKLREAVALDPSRVETALALTDALATLGAHEEAATGLRASLGSIDPSTLTSEKVAKLIAMMQRELTALGRRPQSLVAEEILAFLGYGSPERLRVFRTRPLPDSIPQPMAFDRVTLERAVVPPVGQGVLLRIAATLEEIAPKLLRLDPAGLGATSAMRLSARANHPRRAMADRIARAFGTMAFDLYVDVPALTVPRVIPGSPTALLLPPGFDNLTVTEQAVGLARLLAAVALGVPWVDEVSNEDLTGWVFGALSAGRPGWDGGGLHPSKDGPASTWRPIIQKAISRKGRNKLDEIAEEARLDMDPVAWRHAMHLATWRCAYALTADWTATLHHAWRSSRDLSGIPSDRVAATLFGHSVLRDLALWGLSAETTPLLRAAGHAG